MLTLLKYALVITLLPAIIRFLLKWADYGIQDAKTKALNKGCQDCGHEPCVKERK